MTTNRQIKRDDRAKQKKARAEHRRWAKATSSPVSSDPTVFRRVGPLPGESDNVYFFRMTGHRLR